MNVERERENDQIPNCPTNHNHYQQPAPPAGLCLCARYIYTQRQRYRRADGQQLLVLVAKKVKKSSRQHGRQLTAKATHPPARKTKLWGAQDDALLERQN